MTPTLFGRWQTRLLLLSTLGLSITLLYGYFVTSPDYITPLFLLGYVIIIGFLWDCLYIYLQGFRWDNDWPAIFQVASGIIEGVFLWWLIQSESLWQQLGLIHLPGISPDLDFATFAAHYGSVWLVVFIATQGPLRVIFLRWRYHGGEWL